MACVPCMTNTNTKPCCGNGRSRSFGNLSGFSPFGTENPPWMTTVVGLVGAYISYTNIDEESDVAVPILLGSIAIPAVMWLEYIYPPVSE